MSDAPREQLLQLIQHNPYVTQQALAEALGVSRSAVAGHVAALTREGRLLGRAYVLPQRRPIVCIGGANIDRKLSSIAPVQAGTSNPAHQTESWGGVARNIAENLARLGAPVHLLTAVGDDATGSALLAHAQSLGMHTQGTLHVAGSVSGSYTAVLAPDGELVLALAHMGLVDQLTPHWLAQTRAQRIGAALWLADLNLPADTLAALCDDAAHSATPLVLVAVSAPKMARLPATLQGVRLLILNQDELAALSDRPLRTRADLSAACLALRERGVQDVVLTLGADGLLCTQGHTTLHLTPPPVVVRDVTGAGDALTAGVCWSLVQASDDLALACRRGQHLAALTLQSEASVSPDIHARTLIDPPHTP